LGEGIINDAVSIIIFKSVEAIPSKEDIYNFDYGNIMILV
jgi:NhaP-type Na+/H+ or K+/H+ antiporter